MESDSDSDDTVTISTNRFKTLLKRLIQSMQTQVQATMAFDEDMEAHAWAILGHDQKETQDVIEDLEDDYGDTISEIKAEIEDELEQSIPAGNSSGMIQ